jgi:uncharacterized protein (DUF1330 family)
MSAYLYPRETKRSTTRKWRPVQGKLKRRYGAHEDPEGPSTEGTIILEFQNLAAATPWYSSPAYRKVSEHRWKGANYHVMLEDGV